ncbi:MAG TPA: hypothetical protein VJ436_12380, partial [Anaerolineales bacterium]|nr:hypothetical protein [Anaerolineales bacterium]
GLWFGLGFLWWALVRPRQAAGFENRFPPVGRRDWAVLGVLLSGYLLVMGPWMAHNLAVTGTLFSPGAPRALWITGYDELYLYPAGELTPARWWGVGLVQSVMARFAALGDNMQTALAVQGQIFLAPLILAGAWRLRADRRVQFGLLAWGATGLVMTLVFPFQGSRGGYFHSGAALQPFFWVLAPIGLQALIDWGVRRRGWLPAQAWPILGGGLVGLAVVLTIVVTLPRLAGDNWGGSAQVYQQVERFLQENGAQAGEAVLVNNPPGYFAASGRPALAIPSGDTTAAQDVAWRYGGVYLLLEGNHPQALEALYHHPEDSSGWQYLQSAAGVHIFRLETAGQKAGN